MILDSIIGFFASVLGFLGAGIAMAFVPLINLIAAGIEAVAGIFVTGFSLRRIERRKGDWISPASAAGGIIVMMIIIGLSGWFVIAPKVIYREVTLIAEDGHSLPFAALMIHTESGEQHRRTDNAGNILIPRFSTTSITVKDPRYVEKTWQKSEIKSELIVGRTTLGSGLDSLADRLLKPANE